MDNIILNAVIALSGIGVTAAVVLYFVAQKFKVIEDPRIDVVEAILPGANCGGCGFAGCRAFAEAIVAAGNLDNLNCPVGGNTAMAEVAKVLGLEAEEKEPLIAVLRCNGSLTNAKPKVKYDGPLTCAFAHNLYSGESGCPFGCLGLGDCVDSCKFDALYMDKATGLPVVIQDNCVACNACVKSCPRGIFELRPKGKKDRRIYVGCINEEKGASAKKNCEVACIGCGKCVKECQFDAITLINNLAYIDPYKCKLCRKCALVCPTNSIHELNFSPRKEKLVEKVDAPTEPAPVATEG
ncbi:MAG TPA: RnfABCDGE type electron transport complex subunit B [Bacteroidales bacterium]|nr:RnfABCDGE type electron transport complex subunit B [Bacteroidales bacterium]